MASPLVRGLADEERVSVIKILDWSARKLLEAVMGTTGPQWRFRPDGGGWSIGQIVEHVTTTEQWITGRISRLVEKHSPSYEKQAEVAGKETLILQTVPDRTERGEAPEIVRPSLEPRGLLEALEAFLAVRNRSIAFMRETQADLHGYYAKHGTLDLLDGYQWYLLIGVHTERHTKQIAELRARAGF
jgi:DinB family protein